MCNAGMLPCFQSLLGLEQAFRCAFLASAIGDARKNIEEILSLLPKSSGHRQMAYDGLEFLPRRVLNAGENRINPKTSLILILA
jgi:hypothetical protein